MDIELHKYIKNYDDFIRIVKLFKGNLPILLEKKKVDALLINNNDNTLLLKYYKRERKKLLKQIKEHDFLMKVEIKDFGFTINKEDFKNHLEFIKDFNFEKVDGIYVIEKEEVKHLRHFFNCINNSVWIAFYNSQIEELKGCKKETSFDNPVFENAESKMFFEFLIKEWFNTLPKPISAISFVLHIMRTNDNDLETEFKGLKYLIKDIRLIDFAHYWNNNYKDLHKHKYSIKINFKTARFKTFNEINAKTYINKLNSLVEKFENKD